MDTIATNVIPYPNTETPPTSPPPECPPTPMKIPEALELPAKCPLFECPIPEPEPVHVAPLETNVKEVSMILVAAFCLGASTGLLLSCALSSKRHIDA